MSPVEEGPDKTGLGIDEMGVQKIKQRAVWGSLEAAGGGVTGASLVSIAIEQGWISPTLPTDKPTTFVAIISVATWVMSIGVTAARKFFGKFPIPK